MGGLRRIQTAAVDLNRFLALGTLGQSKYGRIQGAAKGLAPLVLAGFGEAEVGQLFRLLPRSPSYLVSLRANLLAQPEGTECLLPSRPLAEFFL